MLLALLLAQTIGLATQVRRKGYPSHEDGQHVHFVRAWPSLSLTPVEASQKHASLFLRDLWHGYLDLRHVRQHDRDLQYQINQLRLREAALAEDARQGQRLQQLLAFKQHYIGRTVAAEVVGTGGGDQSRVLTIDKGSNDALKPDMAVITPDGPVGKLRDVFAHSAQVLLLNDVSSGAGVILVSTRIRGILHGGPGGQLLITNLMPDERIKPGETVITSGGDQIFPRGMTVGTISEIHPDREHPPYAAITIKPAANLDRLEEVLVVTDVTQQLARSAPGDDEANGNTKASEVLAARLPGVKAAPAPQDDTNGPTSGNAAQQPGTALPKPLPVMHTDRYSPGAIPSAAALQPGGQHTELIAPTAKPAKKSVEETQP